MSGVNPFLGATTSQWICPEVTPGVLVATPAWQQVRYTGGLPTLTKDTLLNEELDDSREITDVRTGNESLAGEFGVILSPGTFGLFFENALRTTKIAGISQSGVEITVDSVAKTFTRTAGDFVSDGVTVGTLMRFVDLTGDNAKAFIATAVTATVVTGAAITLTLTSEVVTTDYVTGDEYKTGSECKTFSVLTWMKGRCGTVEKFMISTGIEATGFSFELAVNSNSTGSFPMIGRSQYVSDTLPAGSTFIDATTSRIFSNVDGKVLVDNEVIPFTSISMTNDNAASPQFELGDKSVSFVEIGKATNTVSLSAFMRDFTLHDMFLNETSANIAAIQQNEDGAISFSYPKTFLTAPTPEIGGETSITQTLEGTATGNKNQSSLIIQEIVY